MTGAFSPARFALTNLLCVAFQAGLPASPAAQTIPPSTHGTTVRPALVDGLTLTQQEAQYHCYNWNTLEFFKKTTASLVNHCLARGAELTTSNDDANTPLHWAARVTNDPQVVHALLSAVADGVRPALGSRRRNPRRRPAPARRHSLQQNALQQRNRAGYTPTQLAAQYNPNPAILETLLHMGADPQQRTKDDGTLLHLAVQHNAKPEIIKLLLLSGADPGATNRANESVAHIASERLKTSPVLDALLEDGSAPLVFDVTPFRDENRFFVNFLDFSGTEEKSHVLPGPVTCLYPEITVISQRSGECISTYRVLPRVEPVFLEAQLAGDVPVHGQRAVSLLASAVGRGFGDGKRHWARQLYGTIALDLRMLYGRSRPVLPPSFMPKVTLQAIGFKNDTNKRVTMHVVNLVLYGHHSNGQVGCPFLEQIADSAGTCPEPDPARISGFNVNTSTGNFSTHYVQASKYYRWIDLSDGRKVLRQKSLGVMLEQHLWRGAGTMDTNLAARYGRTRLWVVFERETERTSRRARIQIIFGTHGVVRRRFGWELEHVWYLRRRYWPGTGIYLRAYQRQDPYNIRFETATARFELGLRFGWEGGPLVWR